MKTFVVGNGVVQAMALDDHPNLDAHGLTVVSTLKRGIRFSIPEDRVWNFLSELHLRASFGSDLAFPLRMACARTYKRLETELR